MDKQKIYAQRYGARAALFLDNVFRAEGGFSDDPMDAGGQTMRGVTFETFRNSANLLGKRFADEDDARAYHATLSEDDAAAIYIHRFWLPTRMHTLPQPELAPWGPLAVSVADHQVNCGSWGIIGLQRLVKVKEDGAFGPVSLAAVSKRDPMILFWEYQKWRRAYYRGVKILGYTEEQMKAWHAHNGRGLQNRVTNLENDFRKKGLIR